MVRAEGAQQQRAWRRAASAHTRGQDVRPRSTQRARNVQHVRGNVVGDTSAIATATPKSKGMVVLTAVPTATPFPAAASPSASATTGSDTRAKGPKLALHANTHASLHAIAYACGCTNACANALCNANGSVDTNARPGADADRGFASAIATVIDDTSACADAYAGSNTQYGGSGASTLTNQQVNLSMLLVIMLASRPS